MINDFLKLFQSLRYKNKIIIFSENENLFIKIFKEYENFFVSNKIEVLIITYQNPITNHLSKRDYSLVNYVNFNNIDILNVFIKKIKNKIILTSTPTINKSISNNSNLFIFIQHSLIKLSNKYLEKHIKYFDIITVSSKDQYEDAKILMPHNSKIIFNKYHNYNFISSKFEPKNKKKSKETILIASSFYGNYLLKIIDKIFIDDLLKEYNIVLRPHPENYKNKEMINKLKNFYGDFDNYKFKISNKESNFDAIRNSDYLITDFSGIGLTYSFHKLTPTIFVLHNQSDYDLLYESYSNETIKNIGYVINYNKNDIFNKIKKIKNNKKYFGNMIKNYRDLQLKEYNISNKLKNFILNELI